MRSAFGALETARRAMNVNRIGMEVAANNIANAQTPGYVRRRAVLTPTRSLDVTTLHSQLTQIGTGVQLENIVRLESAYARDLVRRDSSDLGRASAQVEASGRLEMTLMEPTDSGLQEVMNAFWNAWAETAKRPEESGVRSILLEQGRVAAESVTQLAKRFAAVAAEESSALGQEVDDLNNLARQVSEVNKQIFDVRGSVIDPAELLDKRELLFERMASLVDIKVSYNDDGTTSVLGGGRWLVDRMHVSPVTLQRGPLDGILRLATPQGDTFTPAGGTVGGRFVTLNTAIPGYRAELDGFATALANGVNAIHRQGYPHLAGAPPNPATDTGRDFFTIAAGSDGAAMGLRLALTSASEVAVNRVALGPPVVTTPGAIAQEIADLRETSVTDKYVSLVGSVARGVQKAQRDQSLSEAMLAQAQNMSDEVSGVSTDEEMLDIVKYEAGFTAAAKVVGIIDEMIQTILGIIK